MTTHVTCSQQGGLLHHGIELFIWGCSPGGSDSKEVVAMQDTRVQFLGQDDPSRREWLPNPVFLPGESH